jgi:hypothetical protein
VSKHWVSNPVWLGGTLVGAAAGAFAVFFGTGTGVFAPGCDHRYALAR